MARKTTALEIEMKRYAVCMCAYARAETTGERAAKKGTRGAAAREQEEINEERYLRIRVCRRIAGSGDIATD